MAVDKQPDPELPPCELVADTGGITLLPYPRSCTLKGSTFHIATACYLYISTRANQNVRKRFAVMADKLPALGIRLHISGVQQLAPMQAIFTDTPQFPKWAHTEPQLRGEAARAGGYKITVTHDGITLLGADENGVQHACSTLLQLLEDGPDVPGMELDDYPILQYRAVHLDFKGWPPRMAWLKKAIESLAAVKINVLILEYEAHLHYPSHPELAAEGALTPREIQELDSFARDNGVTLVPLLSCVGNAGHVLARSEFSDLREHAESARMFCVASADALEFLTAQLTDLLPMHAGKLLHVGGDGAFLLGSHPKTRARAEILGGLDAVYLEHLGSVCRHLSSSGVQPLLWDEMFRGMSDEQIKWLPLDVAYIFWLPSGLNGDIAKDVLTQLERYKSGARQVWGSALISPTEQFEAFDSIDAWAKLAESNYISGFVASVRTREVASSAMLPPTEAFWPALYYAADRAWTGKRIVGRELFPQRFASRFYGLKNREAQSQMWAGVDSFISGNPLLAHAFFRAEARLVPKNAETARFMASWTALQAFVRIFLELEADIRGNFVHIQNGSVDALIAGDMRWRAQELKARAPALIAQFVQAAEKITNEWAVHEYIESAFAYTLRRIDEIEPLLSGLPMPAPEFQEPIGI